MGEFQSNSQIAFGIHQHFASRKAKRKEDEESGAHYQRMAFLCRIVLTEDGGSARKLQVNKQTNLTLDSLFFHPIVYHQSFMLRANFSLITQHKKMDVWDVSIQIKLALEYYSNQQDPS